MTESDETAKPSKPKVYIDEDWKSQAQREKEELAKQYEAEKKKQSAGETPLPPPTFAFLVSTLSTQAMIAMGVLESPLTGKVEANLHQAKHFIDTIQMLEEKTKGNLTPQEAELMQSVLHELRLGYVQAASGPTNRAES
jgi:hypothetical protein